MLKDQNASVYIILWESICQFHIVVDVTRLKGAFVWHKKWMEYFFANLDRQKPVAINSAPSVEELKKYLEQFKVIERVLDEEEGLDASTILLSY